jgi:hypothetical protein
MTFPTVTPLPDAPSRTQTPDEFATTADTFVAALPDLVTDVNAAGAYIDEKTISVGNDFQGAYSAGTTYTTGQSVLYNDLFYLSLVDSNTGNTPDSSPSQWVEIAGAASGGGGGGTYGFVATGTIGEGAIVGLNSDGTVSVLSSAYSATTYTSGTSTSPIKAGYDSTNNKLVIAYSQGGSGYAIVGTVSDTSITFGTPVAISSGNTVYPRAIVFDTLNDKVVVVYQGNSNYGYAVVGTVSGTSISFGTPVVFESANTFYATATFDSSNNKVFIGFGAGVPYGIVGTVSGTSISFGTKVTINGSATIGGDSMVSAFDSSNNKVVVGYRNGSSGYETYVGTISGTSVSFGSMAAPTAANIYAAGMTFDSSSNVIIIAWSLDSTYLSQIRIGTVSGTSISYGSFGSLDDSDVDVFVVKPVFDPTENKVRVFYNASGLGVVAKTVTVSGTTPVLSDRFSVITSYGLQDAVYDSNLGKPVIVGNINSVTTYQAGAVNFAANFQKWVGFNTTAVTDGQTATVTVVGGVNENQSGLSVGELYYVQADTTYSTTVSSGREIGRAIAADKILVTQGSIS